VARHRDPTTDAALARVMSLSHGSVGAEEVSEMLGVGASKMHKVVLLFRGSDNSVEVSKRMGLATAMSLGHGSDGTEEVR
ncbi:unnamed protein product, partial [Citrullus colocynthis]